MFRGACVCSFATTRNFQPSLHAQGKVSPTPVPGTLYLLVQWLGLAGAGSCVQAVNLLQKLPLCGKRARMRPLDTWEISVLLPCQLFWVRVMGSTLSIYAPILAFLIVEPVTVMPYVGKPSRLRSMMNRPVSAPMEVTPVAVRSDMPSMCRFWDRLARVTAWTVPPVGGEKMRPCEAT